MTYKTAWFVAHRIREAMADHDPEPFGGKGKVVEVDETFHGSSDDVFVSGKGWQKKRGTVSEAEDHFSCRAGRPGEVASRLRI